MKGAFYFGDAMLKAIPGFPDYFASEDGNMWSTRPQGGASKAKHPKPSPIHRLKKIVWSSNDTNPYNTVKLHRDGQRLTVRVSNIVAELFIGPKPEGMVVRHGVKGSLGDSLDNLSYGTQSQNCGEDKIRDGTMLFGSKNHLSKLNELQVRVIRRYTKLDGSVGCSKYLSHVFGVHYKTLWDIVSRHTWTHI